MSDQQPERKCRLARKRLKRIADRHLKLSFGVFLLFIPGSLLVSFIALLFGSMRLAETTFLVGISTIVIFALLAVIGVAIRIIYEALTDKRDRR